MASKKPPSNPVTQSDADAFGMYMKEWQDRLNLNDWRIVQSPKRAKGSCAEISKRDLASRLATYRIGESFGAEPVTARTIEQTAIHELLHVFLFELLEFAKNPNTPPADMESAEHRVIHVLERLLVPEN